MKNKLFQRGQYSVEIKAVKAAAVKMLGTSFFVVEVKVLESNNRRIKVGEVKKYYVDLSEWDARRRVQVFVAVVSGLNAQANRGTIRRYWKKMLGGVELTFATVCECLVSDENPLEGIKLNLRVTRRLKHIWSLSK